MSAVQNARKDAGLEITDRIALRWQSDDAFTAKALRTHGDDIANVVLAVRIEEGAGATTVDVNGVEVRFSLQKSPENV